MLLALHSIPFAPWHHERELLEWQRQFDSSKNSDVSQSFAGDGNFDVQALREALLAMTIAIPTAVGTTWRSPQHGKHMQFSL